MGTSKNPARVGQVFGRLALLQKVATSPRVVWKCKCSCGAVVERTENVLKRHAVQSCGCLRREQLSQRVRRHGESSSSGETAEHRIWTNMLNRCRNPRLNNYHLYGGRGIKVCVRWKKYINFLTDMGRRPTPEHSLDRINVDGNYTPRNCRWATRAEQSSNRRDNRRITLGTVTKTMAEWYRDGGVPAYVLNRLRRGWSPQDAVQMPRYHARAGRTRRGGHDVL